MRAAWAMVALLVLLAPPVVAHAPHDPILDLALSPDFARDRTLFVSVKGFALLLRSTDGGESFELAHRGLASPYVSALAISPDFARDRTVWVTNGRDVAVSRDAGEHWRTLPLGLGPDVGILDLVASGGALLAATNVGLLHVDDAGGARPPRARLVERPLALLELARCASPAEPAGAGARAGEPGAAAAADPDAPLARFLAARDTQGVLLSFDGGASFVRVRLPRGARATSVLLTARGPSDADLWVGTRDGRVLRTPVDAPDLQPVGEPLPGGAVLSLAAAHAADGAPVVFASTASGGAHEHRDGAWITHVDGLRALSGQSKQHHLQVVPSPAWAEDRTLFLATFEGLHRKLGDAPWEWLVTLPRQLVRDVQLAWDFARSERLFVCGYGDGLLVSDDGGASFRVLDSGPWKWPDGVGASPDFARDGHVILGGPNRQLVSRDGGRRWQLLLQRQGGFLDQVRFAPDYATSGEIFAQLLFYTEAGHSELLVSRDRGATWTRSGPREVNDFELAQDFAGSGRVWIATGEGLAVSDDRGASFRPVPCPLDTVQAVAAVQHEGELLLAVGGLQGELATSLDEGASWTRRRVGVPVLYLDGGTDAEGRAHLFAATASDGVYGSRDAGVSWRLARESPPRAFGMDVCADFAASPTLLVAGYRGPWLSHDAGASWTLLDIDARPDAESAR